MKLKWALAVICVAFFFACGDKHYNAGAERPFPDGEGIDFGLSDEMGNINIVGNYNITEMEFDSDPSDDNKENAIVSTVMRNVYTSNNGEGKFIQAAIDKAHVEFMKDGTFALYYKFINASNQTVTVGKFSEGTQEGIYEIFGNSLLFYPKNSESPGFAHADDTIYTGTTELTSTNLIAKKNSPSGDYLLRIKVSKK